MKHSLILLFFIFAIGTSVQADEAMSLTTQETYSMVQNQGDQILFIDIRDPVEIMFTGFTDAVDTNIPFKFADSSEFQASKGRFAMNANPDFAKDVRTALQEKGLNKDSLIITMCRSGSNRGKPSAEYLINQGFNNVKYVDHGFQGSAAKEGPKKGMRVVGGWQNDGLPWSMRLNPEKIYRH